MTTSTTPRHLAERAAARLGEIGQARQDDAAAPPSPAKPPPEAKPEAAAPLARLAAASVNAAEPSAASHAAERLSLRQLENAGLQVGGPTRSRISEEYQVFSAQLIQAVREIPGGTASNGAPANLIMVTSTRPAEGKSFTAVNLATSLARTRNVKTILIDGDPKQNSLSVLLGLSNVVGLFDLAADPDLAIMPVLVPAVIDNLYVLAIGTISQAHGTTHRVAELIGAIARQFPDHMVVYDAPPCLSTSDPSTLSPHIGLIVMVVEAERTQKRELSNALDLLRPCPNIVMILNKVKFGGRTRFGAYGYYGA